MEEKDKEKENRKQDDKSNAFFSKKVALDKSSDSLEIGELNKKLKECEKIKKEYLAGWQRSRADFLNYKKEELERIRGILEYANEDLILKILSILDNIYLAESKIPNDLENNSWVKGILQIKKRI